MLGELSASLCYTVSLYTSILSLCRSRYRLPRSWLLRQLLALLVVYIPLSLYGIIVPTLECSFRPSGVLIRYVHCAPHSYSWRPMCLWVVKHCEDLSYCSLAGCHSLFFRTPRFIRKTKTYLPVCFYVAQDMVPERSYLGFTA